MPSPPPPDSGRLWVQRRSSTDFSFLGQTFIFSSTLIFDFLSCCVMIQSPDWFVEESSEVPPLHQHSDCTCRGRGRSFSHLECNHQIFFFFCRFNLFFVFLGYEIDYNSTIKRLFVCLIWFVVDFVLLFFRSVWFLCSVVVTRLRKPVSARNGLEEYEYDKSRLEIWNSAINKQINKICVSHVCWWNLKLT